MSISINRGAPHRRSILAPIVVLGVMVLLTLVAVKATETTRFSHTQEELVPLPATQPLQDGGNIVYGEPIAMP